MLPTKDQFVQIATALAPQFVKEDRSFDEARFSLALAKVIGVVGAFYVVERPELILDGDEAKVQDQSVTMRLQVRKLLEALIDAEGEPVSYGDLAQAVGVPKHSNLFPIVSDARKDLATLDLPEHVICNSRKGTYAWNKDFPARRA
jgi:hypothetical protein